MLTTPTLLLLSRFSRARRYPTRGLTLGTVPSIPGSVRGAFALASEKVHGHLARRSALRKVLERPHREIKRPGKAGRGPLRTPIGRSPFPAGTRPTGGGRDCRHRIPGKAAGPTSGSPSLPPSAPPPPACTKPVRRRGPGLLGGRPDETGPGPGAPRPRPPCPGASRVPVPDGADAPPGWP